ncbi:tripartite tricarboxylate transporter TctB family protein [Aeromicrobium stalagmiti]|uniref:tripartite tricarboxylate transporter TctB family protein n=1 Tax=Aeromicrobium stalagmiti TaxID=2738988 RepID=UPI001569B3E5|nr:tripartite tricarboxylate transporter TctB family protein [Aeromicrobium stalagmiti]NRQ50630.1 tripartite tricarboxylate transporter TctB family protein [Aeromicrobium stalagmiti]
MTTIEKPVGTGTRIVDKAQYGLAAFLAVVGAYVVYDATTLEDGFADQPVQPYAFPYVVGAALLLLAALLAIATARGDAPTVEDGEDVDLTEPSDWVTVMKLVAVFVANILLIDWLGWAITGAMLFVGTAYVLGSRTLIRDVAVGVALSVGTWYGFYSGLGLAIPAGVLDGIL